MNIDKNDNSIEKDTDDFFLNEVIGKVNSFSLTFEKNSNNNSVHNSSITSCSEDRFSLCSRIKYLEEQLLNAKADKDFVWSLWRQLQLSNPDLTNVISLVLQREKEKSEEKDKKVLNILKIKDTKLKEYEIVLQEKESKIINLNDKIKNIESEFQSKEEEFKYFEMNKKTLEDKQQMLEQLIRLKEDIIKNLANENEANNFKAIQSIKNLEKENKELNKINQILKLESDNHQKKVIMLNQQINEATWNYEVLINEMNKVRLSVSINVKKESEKLKNENEILIQKLNSELDFASQQKKLIEQLKLIQLDLHDTIKVKNNNIYALEKENFSLKQMYGQISKNYEEILVLIKEKFNKKIIKEINELTLKNNSNFQLIKSQNQLDKYTDEFNLQNKLNIESNKKNNKLERKTAKKNKSKQRNFCICSREKSNRYTSTAINCKFNKLKKKRVESRFKQKNNFNNLNYTKFKNKENHRLKLKKNDEGKKLFYLKKNRLSIKQIYELLKSKQCKKEFVKEINELEAIYMINESYNYLETENLNLKEQVKTLKLKSLNQKIKTEKFNQLAINLKKRIESLYSGKEKIKKQLKSVIRKNSKLKKEIRGLKKKKFFFETKIFNLLQGHIKSFNLWKACVKKMSQFFLRGKISKKKLYFDVKSINKQLKECYSAIKFDHFLLITLKKMDSSNLQSKVKEKWINSSAEAKLGINKKKHLQIIKNIKSKIKKETKKLTKLNEQLLKNFISLKSKIKQMQTENEILQKDIMQLKKKESNSIEKEILMKNEYETAQIEAKKNYEQKLKQSNINLNQEIKMKKQLKFDNDKLINKLKVFEEKFNQIDRDNTQKKQLIEFYKKKNEELKLNQDNEISLNNLKRELKKNNELNEQLRNEIKNFKSQIKSIQNEKKDLSKMLVCSQKLNKELEEKIFFQKNDLIKNDNLLKEGEKKIKNLQEFIQNMEVQTGTKFKIISNDFLKTLNFTNLKINNLLQLIDNYEILIKDIYKTLVCRSIDVKKLIFSEKKKIIDKNKCKFIEHCENKNIKTALDIASNVLNLTVNELDNIFVSGFTNQSSCINKINSNYDDEKNYTQSATYLVNEFDKYLGSFKIKKDFFENSINQDLKPMELIDKTEITKLILERVNQLLELEKELFIIKSS